MPRKRSANLMRKSATDAWRSTNWGDWMERSSPRQVSAAIIIAGIFYGDVWVGITLPIAFLLSPVLIAMIDKGIRPVPPVGSFVLGALSLVVVVQTIIGYPVYSRSDIIVYLPIIYGG